MITPGDLAGLALHSDDVAEIEAAVRDALRRIPETGAEQDGGYLLAACAHAVGHMARRFPPSMRISCARFWRPLKRTKT